MICYCRWGGDGDDDDDDDGDDGDDGVLEALTSRHMTDNDPRVPCPSLIAVPKVNDDDDDDDDEDDDEEEE